ncbi:hypothetical protein VNO77_01654 [Canavalia gladiata]|uniref:Uncharacterized protein n=1 Tax=Canavalia gladiata TaxID=3824 RepID=A0AAN9R5F2_CANGL
MDKNKPILGKFNLGVDSYYCPKGKLLHIYNKQKDSSVVLTFEHGIAAHESGAFKWEMVLVEISGGNGKSSTIVNKDENLDRFGAVKLRKLTPCFKERVSGEKALKLGLHVIAKVRGCADAV